MTTTFKKEALALVKLSLPNIAAYTISSLHTTLTIIFVGNYLSTDEFGAIALGSVSTNLTGFILIMGILTPMDTLCSRSSGSKNWKLFRHTTIRSIVFCVLLSLCIIIPIWIFSFRLLTLLRQPSDIAYKASVFCRIYIAILPCYISKEVLRRFLVCQSISKPLFYIGIICELFFHPTLLYVIFHVLQIKHFVFAPLCNLITCYLYLILLIFYMFLSTKIAPESLVFPKNMSEWRGIMSWEGVQVKHIEMNRNEKEPEAIETLRITLLREKIEKKPNVKTAIAIKDNGCKEYVELAIFGTFAYCGEWWQMELITIFSGMLGADQLNAHMIFYQLETLLFMIPLGISISAASRVGYLFAGHHLQMTQYIAWFSIIFTVCVDGMVIGILLIIHFKILDLPLIFTQDDDIVAIANHLVFLFASLFVFDSFQAVGQGILRGLKLQKQTAMVACISLYCVGLPACIALGFPLGADLKVFGFWIGQNIGYGTFCVCLIFILMLYPPKKGVQYQQLSRLSSIDGSIQCNARRISIH